MPRMKVGDCTLHVERHGDGFPVLLISGLSGLASYWQPQIAFLSRQFSVVVHDHRGVGHSDHDQIKYTVERMSADVIQLMDSLEIEKAHIVGHSTGGAIAQILAIDHPQRVGALVIAASWSKPDAYFRREFVQRRELLRAMGPEFYVQNNTLLHYPPAYIAANNEALRSVEAQAIATFAPLDIMASRIDAILAFDRSHDLGKITAPTMVIGAADDFVTPPAYSEALARAIPSAELKLFPAGGHCFTQIAARDFNQAVSRFLLAHSPTAKA